MKKLLLSAALICGLSLGAAAQDNRYSTWSDPNAPQASQSGELGKMIKELRTLVDEAQRARAADPNFFNDLKRLANKYENTWHKVLFEDGFLDGDFTNNPAWKVASGKYWVERGYGLRSFIEPRATTTTQEQTNRKISKEEAIIGILGAVLGGQVQQQGGQTQQQTQTQAQEAQIYLHTPVSNAFSLKMDISSWKKGGQLSFGPYQGTNRNTGYRLVYRSGSQPALQLYRQYKNGSSVVDVVSNLNLEDEKNHTLTWTRTKNGEMKVSLDDKTLMQVTDRGFRDDFSGFVMTNHGGDYIVKSVSMMGM